MVLSSLLPEKKSHMQGIPIIPGGTFYGGHLHLLQGPNFQAVQEVFSIQHANGHGRCTFYMGPTTPSLSVTHCDDVQLLLKATAHRNVFPLMQTHMEQLFGNQNVAFLNDKEWKQQRSRITKALHPTFSGAQEEAFVQATRRMMEAIPNIHSNNDDADDNVYDCPDVVELFKALTLDCFGQAAFHADFGTCEQYLNPNTSDAGDAPTDSSSSSSAVGPAFDALSKDIMRRMMSKDVMNPSSHIYSLPTPANNTFAREKKKLLDFLRDIIEQRQAQIKEAANADELPQDLLSSFLEYFEQNQKENNTDNSDPTTTATPKHEELALIIAQSILVLLFAGYETSSVTLSYAIYELSKHPDALTKCREEIEQFQKSKSESSSQVYLEAVLKETLRLYPPAVSTTRSAERDLELPAVPGGPIDPDTKVVVPKGTYLYVPIWAVQRDAKHFASPTEFQPERWAQRRNNNDSNSSWEPRSDANHKAWIPFSAGARACPGHRFAMQEMTTILTTLLLLLTFEAPPDDYVLEPHRDGFIQSPKGGIPMKIRKHVSS